jgi:hypothetical protein
MQKVIFLPKVDQKYGSNIKPRMFNWACLPCDAWPSETHPLGKTKTKTKISQQNTYCTHVDNCTPELVKQKV